MNPGDVLYFAGGLSQVEAMGFHHGLQLVTSKTEEDVFGKAESA